MVIRRQFCHNHPDRQAIGVCVITHRPICSECSTRYEGVNYSKEGLRILQERRRAAEKPGKRNVQSVLFMMIAPLMVLLMYWCYYSYISMLINLLHWG